ncbi:MAG: DUF4167 domain-containing protein [Pseudomonadota bacterium]
MRSSNKSRSRNKANNRNRNIGNVVNRVFDSAGPEGKVRGTPQQIVEKYQGLTRDAQLSGDRVAAENFQQHAEHYLRMLNDAQREQAERQAADAQKQRQNQQNNQPQEAAEAQGGQQPAPQQEAAPQPAPTVDDVLGQSEGSNLVETPEAASNGHDTPAPAPAQRKPRSRTRRSAAKDNDGGSEPKSNENESETAPIQ